MHSERANAPGALAPRLARAAVLAALALAALPGTIRLAVASAPPRIAIVRTSALGPFEQATSAMVEKLRSDPRQPEILTFDLEGDAGRGPALAQLVVDGQPDVVVTVGSLATAAMLAYEGARALPLVFSMVLYPAASGFLGHAGRQVTGASLDVSSDRQFQTLRTLLPQARRVGVLYRDDETGSVVRAAEPDARRYGFEIVAAPVDNPAAALTALAELMDRVDAIWTVADSHVFTATTTSPLLLATLRHRVPLFGLSFAQVRSGALVALAPDYAAVGRQTAELAAKVIAGTPAASLPVTVPDKLSLALNLRTAALLGVTVPPALEAAASEVVR